MTLPHEKRGCVITAGGWLAFIALIIGATVYEQLWRKDHIHETGSVAAATPRARSCSRAECPSKGAGPSVLPMPSTPTAGRTW